MAGARVEQHPPQAIVEKGSPEAAHRVVRCGDHLHRARVTTTKPVSLCGDRAWAGCGCAAAGSSSSHNIGSGSRRDAPSRQVQDELVLSADPVSDPCMQSQSDPCLTMVPLLSPCFHDQQSNEASAQGGKMQAARAILVGLLAVSSGLVVGARLSSLGSDRRHALPSIVARLSARGRACARLVPYGSRPRFTASISANIIGSGSDSSSGISSVRAGFVKRAACATGRRSAASVSMTSSSGSGGGSELDMWRIERARLQEGYRRELLRRPRRYLSFNEARKWARAMWFTEAEDWLGMLDRGEKRNPYLPRRPDLYYRDKGWVSWHDFFNE